MVSISIKPINKKEIKLKLYDTLTRNIKDFVPDPDNVVRMYVCGPTVYDDPHLGHARSIVSFDSIRRIFLLFGYEVKMVLNYTDVDDKIINKSNDTGQSVQEITSRYIESYEKMLSKLKVIKPTVQPRATEHIKEMLDLIEKMEQKGYTYVANGSVYFDTSKISWYKDLFKKFNEEEEVLSVDIGEHVEDKRNPNDFVLWKARKENEPFWESKWGPGRPGWHIECSAMSMKYLGEVLTVHGGGQDLKFPHHQNEIAQTRSVTGKDFARYWLHNGFVTVDGTKMSKSLGNFVTIDSIIEKYSGNILRFFLLSTHYRNPISLSEISLEQAQTSLKRIQMFYSRVKKYLNTPQNIVPDSQIDEESKKGELEIYENASKFYAALANDFNTSEAVSVLFMFTKAVEKNITGVNKKSSESIRQVILDMMKDFNSVFDVLEESESGSEQNVAPLIDFILEIRKELKANKQYKLSDWIRAELGKRFNIRVFDEGSNSTWIQDTEKP